MADEPKKPSASETGKPETNSRVQQIAQTLKESRAERLRRRDELAYSPAVLGENVTKVMGARIATNVERELTDVFGSKIGASIREARRAEPGKKLSAFGRMYLSQLTTSIGGMGIIGEGIANRLRDQRKFEDDPQKEFEKIKGNFIAVSDDLRKTQFNFEKLKKSQEEVAKEVTKTTNLITDLNNTATRLERDFKEFQDVNFRQFKENVERRLSTLEGMAEMRSAPGVAGQQMKTGRGGTSTAGGPSLTDLAITAAGTAAAGSVAARALGYAKAAGRFALRRSPYLIAGYGLYKGIETIGQANEARDRELGIDRNDPRMLTPEGQAEIEQRRREYHGRRKRGVNDEYRAQLEEAKRQSSAPKPTSQKKGLFGLGGFPSTKTSSTQQYAQRFKKESSFGESFDRQMIEREKSQFLQFGQLPRGFEFLPGQMGRLGSPEAVAARGAMPLGGYGEVAGVPGMPRGGYSGGGGNAAGHTTGPTAGSGREGTYAGGRGEPVTYSGSLANIRADQMKQLQDPKIMAAFLARVEIEVGSQGPQAQQAFMESVLNRAAANKLSILDAVNNNEGHRYYPRKDNSRWQNMSSSLNENLQKKYAGMLGDVGKGSNISNYGTDNASSTLAQKRHAAFGGKFVNGELIYNNAGRNSQWARQQRQTDANAPPGSQPVGTQPSSQSPQGPSSGVTVPKIGTASPLSIYSGGDPHKAIADAATGKIPSDSAVVKEAMSVLGLNESKHQKQLIDFMKPAGKGYVDPSSAWCASFVNASLERAGIKGTGSAAAGSFHKWGEKVTDPSKVKAGDVVVNNRRSPRTGMLGSHVDIATGPAFKDKNGNWVIPTVGGNVGAGVVGERQRRFDSHTVRTATPDLYKDPTKANAGVAGGLMGLTPGATQTFGIPTQTQYQFPKEYSAATALTPSASMTENAATQMRARASLPETPAARGVSPMAGTTIYGPGADAFGTRPTSTTNAEPIVPSTDAIKSMQDLHRQLGRRPSAEEYKTLLGRYPTIDELRELSASGAKIQSQIDSGVSPVPTTATQNNQAILADPNMILDAPKPDIDNLKLDTSKGFFETLNRPLVPRDQISSVSDMIKKIQELEKIPENERTAFQKNQIKELKDRMQSSGKVGEDFITGAAGIHGPLGGIIPKIGYLAAGAVSKTTQSLYEKLFPSAKAQSMPQAVPLPITQPQNPSVFPSSEEQLKRQQEALSAANVSPGSLASPSIGPFNPATYRPPAPAPVAAPAAPVATPAPAPTPAPTPAAPAAIGPGITEYKPPSSGSIYTQPGAPTPQPQQMPPESAPVPPSTGPGTIGGIVGGSYGKGPGTEQNEQQREVDKAYRESGLAQQSLEQAQQQSAQAGRTPGDNARGGANGGNSSGGRNNPESAPPSPGSGGSGSYGRCFV